MQQHGTPEASGTNTRSAACSSSRAATTDMGSVARRSSEAATTDALEAALGGLDRLQL
jgi:hypothetical protein